MRNRPIWIAAVVGLVALCSLANTASALEPWARNEQDQREQEQRAARRAQDDAKLQRDFDRQDAATQKLFDEQAQRDRDARSEAAQKALDERLEKLEGATPFDKLMDRLKRENDYRH